MANLVPFNIDLTAHEGTRLAAVLQALGPHWDSARVFADEAEVHHKPYTDFDAGQQAAYDLLIADGVLPRTLGR